MALCRDGDCTTAQKSAAPNNPMPPIARTTLRQPYSCDSQPISGAKATSEKYCEALKMALAVPRSAFGNQLATMRALAGKEGLSANPSAKRRANRLIKTGMKARDETKAWAAVKIAQRVMDQR